MSDRIELRDVVPDDLPILFEHQMDPEATRMAAFPSRQWDAFMEHWAKVLANDDLVKKSVVLDGRVVGSVVSFERAGRREVGYWIAREFWGRGIATRALAELLRIVSRRPLFARVAKHNAASLRVLEKCGFTVVGEELWAPDESTEPVEDLILRLGEDPGASPS